ncbi:MAG: YicC family protein [Pyrinomonadaceae bacterium]|nr:YicC family protein [Pyrinomonadaceae bacterium]
MRSMTGFGRSTTTDGQFSITVELRSVNNRFLDLNLRLPAELQHLESSIKQIVSGRIARGRVDVNLQYDRAGETQFELNRPLIAGFLAAMRDMQQEFSLAGEPDLNVISRLPNVVNSRKEDPSEEFISAVETVFLSAIDDLNTMRSNEGNMLAGVLISLLNGIEGRVPTIEAEAATVADEYHGRLTKRVNDMIAKAESQVELDQGRLAQEVAYLADRADISEEIARLRSHIEHFRQIMAEEADVGKRLDFLTQELNREANTIASKTNNMTVKENALAIKSDIEKIREQVQNIE